MTDSLDDLAAFLMHRTSDPKCTPYERLRIYAVVGAYQEGRDVEHHLRLEASTFADHPDYRQEWRADRRHRSAPPPGVAGDIGSVTMDSHVPRSSPAGPATGSLTPRSAWPLLSTNGLLGDDGVPGRTCPMCGSMPLVGGHCECSYTDFDAHNHPLRPRM